MAMGFSIFTSIKGTVASLNEESPLVMDRFQKDGAFVICCVQMGFMLYYLYSQKLVTQTQVQKICKKYHVVFVLIYLVRIMRDLFTYFTDDENGWKHPQGIVALSHASYLWVVLDAFLHSNQDDEMNSMRVCRLDIVGVKSPIFRRTKDNQR